MVGSALAATGNFDSLRFHGLSLIILFIGLAPFLGMFLGSGIALAVTWMCRNSLPRRVDSWFRKGQLVSAAFFSLGHGGNDAQKTMGIIFVLLLGAGVIRGREPSPLAVARVGLATSLIAFEPFLSGSQPFAPTPGLAVAAQLLTETSKELARTPQVPTEIVLACHLAMGLGTMFGGWRIVKTMGQRIIRLRPIDGFCAETAAAITLWGTTSIGGIPISTTHTITGGIVGVGSLKRLSAVRWGVASQVVWAWILTIPGSAMLAALAWWTLRLL
jgi:PiT family inorganic phosphate transporter